MAEVKAGVVAFGDVFGGSSSDSSVHPSKPAFWAGVIWVAAVLLLLLLLTR